MNHCFCDKGRQGEGFGNLLNGGAKKACCQLSSRLSSLSNVLECQGQRTESHDPRPRAVELATPSSVRNNITVTSISQVASSIKTLVDYEYYEYYNTSYLSFVRTSPHSTRRRMNLGKRLAPQSPSAPRPVDVACYPTSRRLFRAIHSLVFRCRRDFDLASAQDKSTIIDTL
jgi:hypothetical protein